MPPDDTQDDPAPAIGEGPPSLPRLRIALHLALQTVLLLFIFVVVNYLSCRHNGRLDLTANEQFTLSTTTTGYLDSLGQDVAIIVAFFAGSPVYDQVRNLAEEYRRQGAPRISVEFVDPARHLARTADLRSKHGVTLEESTVLVVAGERVKGVTESAMLRRDEKGHGAVVEFRGEAAITAAIIAAVEKEPRKLYLVSGHRKVEELQALIDELRGLVSMQNATVHELLFSRAESVPADCGALLLIGPRVDLTPREIEMLRDYWEKEKGSIIVLLDPNTDTQNLAAFLRSCGISPRNDRVLLAASLPGLEMQKTYSVPAVFLAGSVITRELVGVNTLLPGQTQSLLVHEHDPVVETANLTLTPLLLADERFWGETRHLEAEVAFDKAQDHVQPLYLAAAVEKNAVEDPRLRIRSSRLLVAGNDHLLDSNPQRIKPNSDFILSALNWMLDREELIGIAPVVPADYSLVLSEKQFARIQFIALLVMPAGAFLLAFTTWSLRRN